MTQQEPKRIKSLRTAIVKALPRFPNDKASKQALEQKSLGGLLVAFFNWRMRFVNQGSRSVRIRDSIKQDQRWPRLQADIEAFVKKVENGDDLTPNLSLGARREGYTLRAERAGTASDRWADKDFLLNVMEFHHFHLSTNMEKGGFVTRTDEVLFAHVTRSNFDALGIYDHSVFDDDTTKTMTPERERLWTLHEEVLTEGLPPGSFVVGNMISASGHSTWIVMHAQFCAKQIAKIDPQLDDRELLERTLYRAAHVSVPKKPKLRWAFKHLDLYLCDDSEQMAFLIRRGPY